MRGEIARLEIARSEIAGCLNKMSRANPEEQQSQALVLSLRQFHPEIFEHIFHIPNESRHAYHKDSGVKKGVPDFFLTLPRGGYHGLFIEMKAPKRRNHKQGRCSDDQIEFIAMVRGDGYRAEVCYTWQEALTVVLDYCQGIPADKLTKL